jgi:hypothetical protein
MVLIEVLMYLEQVVFMIYMRGQGLVQWGQPATGNDDDRPMNTYNVANMIVLIICLERFVNHRCNLIAT